MQTRRLKHRIDSLGLDERSWLVLATRVGFAENMTLEKVAQECGLTRERVRQIQAKATKRIRGQMIFLKPVLDELEQEAGRLWVPFEVSSIKLAITICRNTLELSGWSEVDHESVGRLLLVIRSLVYDEDLSVRTGWPKFTFAVSALPPPIKRHPNVASEIERRAREEKEQRRSWTYEELAEAVLCECKTPLHWREIARRAEAIGRRQEFSPQTMFNALLSAPETFVRVNSGT